MGKLSLWDHTILSLLVALSLPSSLASANALGVNYQNFFPTAAQTDYITVHSTESIRAKKWRMHFFGSLSGNNLIAYDAPATGQQSHEITDELLAGSLGVAYGISSNLEYGFSLPMHFTHHIAPQSDRTYLAHRLVTMIHNQFKYVLQRRGDIEGDETGAAVVASIDLPNTRDDGFLGQTEVPIVTAEVVYDSGNETNSYSFNAGYRWRSPGKAYLDSPVLPLQDQLLFSAGYQKRFSQERHLSWIAEFYGAVPLDKGGYKNALDITSAELIFGLRGGAKKAKRWTVGGGTGLVRQSLSADWRVFAGYSWDFTWAGPYKQKDSLLDQRKVYGIADDISDSMAFQNAGPVVEDSDRDGVIDDDDMCPRTPRGVSVDSEGCPLDSDNDSIPDYEDKCPRTPRGEVVNSQGCSVLK